MSAGSGVWIAVFAASLLAAACRSGEPAPSGDSAIQSHVKDGAFVLVPEKSELRRQLVIAAAARRELKVPLEAPAVVEADPSRVANVLPPLAGRIAALQVRLGDTVKAGQPLFTLDSADLAQARADERHAQAAMTQTGKALARAQDLVAHQIAAQKDLEQAQADHDNAVAELERATTVLRVLGVDEASGESLRQLTVRSPVAGRVASLNAVAGTYVNDATVALMTVADISTVWFSASVQEKDLVAVQVGEDIAAQVQAYPGERFGGKVAFVASQLDADTRTVKVRVVHDNRDERLKPGMFATIEFAGTPRQALTVPTSALVQSEAKTLVFVEVEPWKFEPRQVVTGARVGDDTEIVTGLKEGERVVTKQGVLLND